MSLSAHVVTSHRPFIYLFFHSGARVLRPSLDLLSFKFSHFSLLCCRLFLLPSRYKPRCPPILATPPLQCHFSVANDQAKLLFLMLLLFPFLFCHITCDLEWGCYFCGTTYDSQTWVSSRLSTVTVAFSLTMFLAQCCKVGEAILRVSSSRHETFISATVEVVARLQSLNGYETLATLLFHLDNLHRICVKQKAD